MSSPYRNFRLYYAWKHVETLINVKSFFMIFRGFIYEWTLSWWLFRFHGTSLVAVSAMVTETWSSSQMIGTLLCCRSILKLTIEIMD